MLGALGVLAALCALLLGTAAPASAHAVLTGSDPADGAVVGSAPKEVTLTFSEGVSMSDDSIRVLDPDGERADTGELIDLCSGDLVRYGTSLRGGLPDGTYTVAWKAVSADSHPVSGAFTFSIGAPSKTSVGLPQQEAGGGTVGFLYDVGRYAAYAGFVLLVGGAAFVLACWPGGARVRAVQRLVAGGWVAVTAATLVMLLLRHPYDDGGGLADVFDLAGLKAAVGTKPGAALVSRLLLLAAAALFLSVLFGTYTRSAPAEEPAAEPAAEPAEGPAGDTEPAADGETERKENVRTAAERRDLFFGLALGGGVVATGLGATWAMAEHASTGIQTSLAMPLDVVHLLAVAAWLGGLATLLTALHRGAPVTATAVRRFSRLAFGSVLALAATGLYQSWRQVGSWSALVDTGYGQLLLVKVGLIGVLLCLGWFSRRWTARLTDPPPAPADTEPDPNPDPEPDPEPEPAHAHASAPGPAPDPVRAAQLARQRAAAATARRKRARDADPQRAGLRRSVLAEAGVAVVVLAVTTVLTGTEPGRTAEAAQRTGDAPAAVPERPVSFSLPFDTGGPKGAGTAEVTLDPGRTGRNALDLRTTAPDGKPLAAPEVKIAFTLPSQDLGPLRSTPRAAGTGHWTDTGVRLPVAGEWKIALTIRTSDIDQVTETKTVRIG
nr:copper resistance protein CopC [Streptomyces armeniacus]